MTPRRTPGRPKKPVDAESLDLARAKMRHAWTVLRTLEAVAAHYGISKAAAYRIAKDGAYTPSQAVIDTVLAIPLPAPALVSIPPCPDCGSVHHARCNGNGGQAVVLAPGETVRRPAQSKRQRRRYWRPCLPSELTSQQRAMVLEFVAELQQEARNGR